MSPDRRDSDNPEKWIESAEEEFAVALMPNIPPKIRRNHAHQAAEKALKALCLARGMKAIPTHSLQDLLTLLRENGARIPAEVDRVKSMTFDRYPKREESPATPEEAEVAAKNARLALDWVEREIARTPPNSPLAAK